MATRKWDGGTSNAWATGTNWSDDTEPAAGDNVRIPAMVSADPPYDIAGYDASAAALVDVDIEEGCELNLGDAETYLKMDADYFRFRGTGLCFLDIINSTEIWLLAGTSAQSEYSYGMHLQGSSNALLVADIGSGNSLGLAALGQESLAVTTFNLLSGDVTIGESLTSTTGYVDGANVNAMSAPATLTITKGSYRQIHGTPTTLNLRGGRYYHNHTAVPTTINVYPGGIFDLSEDARTKDFSSTTVNLWKGGLVYDPHNVLASGATIVWKDGGSKRIS